MRKPASGVFIWCAAFGREVLCEPIVWSRRASRSLIEHQQGHFLGDVVFIDQARVWLSRRRMRCCSALSGAMPRASANRTSSTASGRDHELRQDHALDDFVSQAQALVEVLGHDLQRWKRRRPAVVPTHREGDAHQRVVAGCRRGTAPRRPVGVPRTAAPARHRHPPGRPARRAPGTRCDRRRSCAGSRAAVELQAAEPAKPQSKARNWRTPRRCGRAAPVHGRRVGWRCPVPPARSAPRSSATAESSGASIQSRISPKETLFVAVKHRVRSA